MDSYDLIEDEPLSDDFLIETMDDRGKKMRRSRQAMKFMLNKKGKISKYEMDEMFLEI